MDTTHLHADSTTNMLAMNIDEDWAGNKDTF